MVDVTDGKYTGPLTLEQVIEQFEFRRDIHVTYSELIDDDPAWEAYGTKEWHAWAINGYEWGIRYLKEKVVYRCSLGEAFRTIAQAIVGLVRRG